MFARCVRVRKMQLSQRRRIRASGNLTPRRREMETFIIISPNEIVQNLTLT